MLIIDWNSNKYPKVFAFVNDEGERDTGIQNWYHYYRYKYIVCKIGSHNNGEL